MTSSQSPRKVLVTAHKLGKARLPEYASKFSRRDFTLPQLFACLVLRQFYNLSHRRAQALLADSPGWRRAIGMRRTPDHNTLCDAFAKLTAEPAVRRMLDELAAAFGEAGLLDLDDKPLAIDSTCFESRHVSRHYERRKGERRKGERRKGERRKGERRKGERRKGERRKWRSPAEADAARSATVRSLPKLAVAVACACHLVLSAWVGTGLGADHPHFEPVLFDAWRRAPVATVVADAGYDSEAARRLARLDMGLRSMIPPWAGRPTGRPPATRFRAEMAGRFAAGATPEPYGQRWQVETVNSMMKRNYGSALRAATPERRERREREMMLKVLTHNIAL